MNRRRRAVRVALLGIIGALASASSAGLAFADTEENHAPPPPVTAPVGAPPLRPHPSSAKLRQVQRDQEAARSRNSGDVAITSSSHLLEASGWSPQNADAYHWFYTNLSHSTGLFTGEKSRVTSGQAQPRWLAQTPWNPYLIRLSTTWTCAGRALSVTIGPIGATVGQSGGSATFTWPDVLGNWQPNFFYPNGTYECSADAIDSMTQSDAVFIQAYSSWAPYLVAVSDTEGI